MLFRTLALACLLSVVPETQATEPVMPQLQGYQAPDYWREPTPPFQLGDHTWYIGTAGITALLVKTPDGAVLIDGGMPQAADMLLSHMQQLGVAPHELKLILHSHAHIDHTGPLAAIRNATGARLVTNAESAVLLARGGSGDLHHGDDMLFPSVPADRLVLDGETIELGGLRFSAHFTPGHTPGSLSWTWTDMRDGKPLRIAYADSLSAPGFRLVDNPRYPHIIDDYLHSFEVVRNLPCDLLITPHPDASGWTPANTAMPHSQPMTCRAYADGAAARFDKQVDAQRKGQR